MKATLKQSNRIRRWSIFGVLILLSIICFVPSAFAGLVCDETGGGDGIPALPGAPEGTNPANGLNPCDIPKFVTPLVIPPVMKNTGAANDYDIAVRQFKQQILPGGIWNTLNKRSDTFNATTVWSYGPAADPRPNSTSLGGGANTAPAPNSQFNYPAYTIENTTNVTTTVDWINDLKRPNGNFLPHLFAVDRSLHWANPELLECMDGTFRTDCRPAASNGTFLQEPYRGPVPLVTHVHGAHTGHESDGYPEAWYLPDANNIAGYQTAGRLVNQYGTPTNNNPGVASFSYPNDQPSTTLWYHDHTLGMTRLNVYAGPAGFWLIRTPGGGEDGLNGGILPGPAPVPGEDLATTNFPASLGGQREKYREIPIVIQDRSFRNNGNLFYPNNRAFFEGIRPGQLRIPFIGDATTPSDISAIWNPEAFFNVMVVNGVSWPYLDVAPERYRFRLLNGSNSRFLNLAMFVVADDGVDGIPGTNDDTLGQEVPFYQIGAEQSLLSKVTKVWTGCKTWLGQGQDSFPVGAGSCPAGWAADDPAEALLMGPAERADVIVDFNGLAPNTRIRLVNRGADAPFGGFPIDEPVDPDTTGQVMEFVVNRDSAGDPSTPPARLRIAVPEVIEWNTLPNGPTRDLALIEEESAEVCVEVRPNGVIRAIDLPGVGDFLAECLAAGGEPFAPKAAVLGTDGKTGGIAQLWSDPIRTNPVLNALEKWELYNYTMDAHPIHLHLVKYRVMSRRPFAFNGRRAFNTGPYEGAERTEAGWKDTVIAYPGEVTTIRARFDLGGLYVWHCHIVEHEDNEMMVPYVVGTPGVDFADPNGTIGNLM